MRTQVYAALFAVVAATPATPACLSGTATKTTKDHKKCLWTTAECNLETNMKKYANC